MKNDTRIYIDGVFDMFHIGHLECLRKCRKLSENPYLIVGIISDKDAESYKRKPIIQHKNRIEIIKALKDVDEVIEYPPLIIDKLFMDKHNIDLVAHSFSNNADIEAQTKFFEVPISLNKFAIVNYHEGISTTSIMEKILEK